MVSPRPRPEIVVVTESTPPDSDAAAIPTSLPTPIADAQATLERSGPLILPALALTVALWWAQAVFIPIVVSVLISYALEPLVCRMESWRMPRAIAVPVIMFAIIAGGGATAMRSIRGEAASRL